MRGSGKYAKWTECKLQAVLEEMFAETCLQGHSKEEAEEICFRRAKNVCKLVKELVNTYWVAMEWERAGEVRDYAAVVYVGPDGIGKGKATEWHRIEVEAAPRPHSREFLLVFAALFLNWQREIQTLGKCLNRFRPLS